jgi:hypothetical protein
MTAGPPIRAEGDKVMRMSAQSAKIEAGAVHLPRHAPWLDDLKSELLAFPLWSPRRSGRFDLAGAELAFAATIATAFHRDLIPRRSFAQARAATYVAKFG